MKASFWDRAVAKIIDHLIFKSLAGLVLVIAVLTAADVSRLINNLLLFLSLLVLLLPLHLLYDTYLTAKLGGTLGKLIVGLEVLDENGKRLNLKSSLYRHTVGYFISGQLCGAGFWWILRQDKTAWHDSLTNTAVLKKTNNLIKTLIAFISLITLIILEATLTVSSLATNQTLSNDIQEISKQLEAPTTLPL